MAVPSQLVSEPKRTEGGTGMTNLGSELKTLRTYVDEIRVVRFYRRGAKCYESVVGGTGDTVW